MKAVRKLVLLSAGLLSSLVASATSSREQVYLETCRKDPEVPVPISVVSPTIGAQYNGSEVQLEFVVRADGRPAEFSIKSSPDDVLAKAVIEAVKQWRFQPAELDGKPVAKKCALPVKIVGDSATGDRFAAFE
jgi:periplasmic protein TonB